MATSHPITLFPANIDRAHFGSWLSGFTDGEGCFRLSLLSNPRYPKLRIPDAYFQIKLRGDDAPVLFLVQSYWSCGVMSPIRLRPPSNPQVTFCVSNANHLITIVIPHFERFPLMAKKAADFGIWKRAVELIHTVFQRPHKFVNDTSCAFGGGKRRVRKWTDDDLNVFYDLQDTMHLQREYR